MTVNDSALEEWKVPMNISATQAARPAPRISKIAGAIAVALAISVLGMTPAYGDERDNHDNQSNRDDHVRHAPPARHQSRHHATHDFYAPAPVYYAPAPSPGISLFIPIVIR